MITKLTIPKRLHIEDRINNLEMSLKREYKRLYSLYEKNGSANPVSVWNEYNKISNELNYLNHVLKYPIR